MWAPSAQTRPDFHLSNKEWHQAGKAEVTGAAELEEQPNYIQFYIVEGRENSETENLCLKNILTHSYKHMLPSPTEHRTLAACFGGSPLAAMRAEPSDAFQSRASEVLYSPRLVISLKAENVKVKQVLRFASI